MLDERGKKGAMNRKRNEGSVLAVVRRRRTKSLSRPPPHLSPLLLPFLSPFPFDKKLSRSRRSSAPSVTRAVVERPATNSSASIASRSPSSSVLAVILGGGAGTRLYPLTKQRAKPAVPIGGAYRLIDVPMSNCINSGKRRI